MAFDATVGAKNKGLFTPLYGKLLETDTYLLIGCGMNKSAGLTSDSTDFVTDCGKETIYGDTGGNISFDGAAINEPDTGDTDFDGPKLSLQTLKNWKKAGLKPFLKLGVDATDPAYIEGQFNLGDLTWQTSTDEYVTFTLEATTADNTFKVAAA